jgi:mono/diheme cytochrome c family protein
MQLITRILRITRVTRVRPIPLLASLALMACTAAGCSRSTEELREWRPSDHAQPPVRSSPQVSPHAPPGSPPPRAATPPGENSPVKTGTNTKTEAEAGATTPPVAPTTHAEAARGGAAPPHPPGLDALTIRVWAQNCVRCHGKAGRGDGPSGQMFKMPNLGDPAWQASTTNAEIATVIRDGRGSMPKFNFPPTTVDNLVRLVRLLGPRKSPPPSQPKTPAPAAP